MLLTAKEDRCTVTRSMVLCHLQPAPMEAFLPPSGILDWQVHGMTFPRTR